MPQAISAFRRVIKEDPLRVDVLNNLGLALLVSGLYKEANNTFKKAVDIDPHYFPLLNSAHLAQECQQLASAYHIFKRMLLIQPTDR